MMLAVKIIKYLIDAKESMPKIRSTAIIFSVITLGLFTGVNCESELIKPPSVNTDTTSHSFAVLRVDTLGTAFSFANGVDIVNENDIWIAGIFTERDSNKEIIYNKNLAHWDGLKWTFISVPMMGYNNTGPDPQELGAVKVFNDSSIFVVAKHDNSVAWWNGKSWVSTYVVGTAVSYKFWARSKNDIYFAAREGKATHWDGISYNKIENGLTNPPLTDVWGDEKRVYMVGYGTGGNQGTESIMLSGNNEQWSIINRYDLLAIDQNAPNYVGINLSVFRKNSESKFWMFGGTINGAVFEIQSLSPFIAAKVFTIDKEFYPFMMRGTADNDLYLISKLHGEFYHYNGLSWKRYTPPIPPLIGFNFAIKNKLLVTVGALSNSLVGSAMVIMEKHE